MTSIPSQTSERSLRATSRSPRSPQSEKSGKKNKKSPQDRKLSLKEVKKKGKMDRSHGEDSVIMHLGQLDLGNSKPVTGTGLAFTEKSQEYFCLWDDKHSECPERVSTVIDKMKQYELLQRCHLVTERAATEEEISLVHTVEYVELMKSTQKMSQNELHSLSGNYEHIYIHPKSFQCARLAVGSVLELVDQVMTGKLRNGFSVCRPPGHHAERDQMSGYCMFNNVAIAASYAKEKYNLKRILIVDWDVHHGQGIQHIFEEDPSVLYFSIHRYEYGRIWPHLTESSETAVGQGIGEGYNINVPWNQTGMKDADYITVFTQLLLPVAFEFMPQLVLVSAGFDSGIGDPKGKMVVTPPCFAILTHMLQPLANGRLILALEGGYHYRSTAESACACLKVLLGDQCPKLESSFSPCYGAMDSISKSIAAHSKFWKCLQILDPHLYKREGTQPDNPEVFPEEIDSVLDRSSNMIIQALPPVQTGLVYDERMMEHYNMWDSHHPEVPQRISRIFSHLEKQGFVERCQRLSIRAATEEELAMCHGNEHINTIKSTAMMKPRDLHKQGDEYDSIYICAQSYQSAILAVGACFSALEALLTGKVSNAVAIVRPPGHHAEKDSACGFCFFNNVALTARYAQKLAGNLIRVLILDWDIHHGNGTQHIFEDDPSVLYISLHRYDNGSFFPTMEDANFDKVGQGLGKGYNVNIPWNSSKMGDPEYIAAFQKVVMPIASEFDPELVLVSAGFDAARGDPLGSYLVTPECYAHMTHMLLGLAGGRVLVVLEGGYNLSSISESMSMCTSVLLGDCLPDLGQLAVPHQSAIRSINNVLQVHCQFWSSLRLNIPDSVRSSLPTASPTRKELLSPRRTSSKKESTPQKHVQQHENLTSEVNEGPLKSLETTAVIADNDSINQITESLQSVSLGSSTVRQKDQIDLEQTVISSLASLSVGGARQKVKPLAHESTTNVQEHQKRSKGSIQTPQSNQAIQPETPEAVGLEPAHTVTAGEETKTSLLDTASGWSKSQTNCEIYLNSQDIDMGTLFAVEPLTWCPHLREINPLPSKGLNVFQTCLDCETRMENWVCLVCYQVHCGRHVNQHMLNHSISSGHVMVLSFTDLSVWCYSCDSYVHNKALDQAKNAAYTSLGRICQDAINKD
ncbi:histone deacetylase 6 isoform X1 [Erpetoichthys calabaricus]|uniref:histone deacetylase 6 isoform X1 n=2 Tax=Erpetoichthys calabaricus TaxID=27687 RepID=UPI0022340CB8|nr:histone deacetylase 6 isoform X1 [Erpetoichthys calabaricus]